MYARARWVIVSAILAVAGCSSDKTDRCKVNPGACVDGGSGAGMVGSECNEGIDCVGTLRLECVDGQCAFASSLAQGDPCKATLECGEGLYCRVEDGSHRCTPAGDGPAGARCEDTAECQRNLVCTYDVGIAKHCVAAGERDIGESCAGPADCLGGLYCTLPIDDRERVCASLPTGVVPTVTWSGLECPADDSEPVAYFEVPRKDGSDGDFFRLPFPNDARKHAGGLDLEGFPSPGDLLGVGIDFVGNYVAAAQTGLDAFSTNPVVYMRFSRAYDAASVGEKTVLLFDIDKDSPSYGRALSRSWGKSSGDVTSYVCENWLNVRTPLGSPLRAGNTYAVIVTTGIKTKEGGASFARSDDFEAMLDGATPEAALRTAHAAYAPLRAFLADPDNADVVKPADVLNAAVFTTVDPPAVVKATREVVVAGEPASAKDLTVCKTGVKSPCDDGDTRVCGAENETYVEVHGRLTLPSFQAGEAPFEQAGGGFVLKDGKPTVQGSEDVCFALSLPKGELPATGYPLVIYAHGTGGSFTTGIRDLAKTAAAAGAAVLSIDMPVHGSRAHGATRGPDELFFNFVNPAAARDNVTQGSADLFALAHYARALKADAASKFGQAVTFDDTKMVWFGHSQGATHASLAAPFEPALAGVVLSGVGGDLSEGLVSKRSPIDLAGTLHLILADTAAGPEGELCPPAVNRNTGKPLTDSEGNPVRRCVGANHPVYGLLQGYFDRVDPVNFGALWAKPPTGVTPKHVFMTFGVGDTFAPDGTQKAYATAANLELVTPELVPLPGQDEPATAPLTANVKVGEVSFTQGVRQYPPEAGKDAHFVYLKDDAAADWQRFVTALLSGEVPAIGE